VILVLWDLTPSAIIIISRYSIFGPLRKFIAIGCANLVLKSMMVSSRSMCTSAAHVAAAFCGEHPETGVHRSLSNGFTVDCQVCSCVLEHRSSSGLVSGCWRGRLAMTLLLLRQSVLPLTWKCGKVCHDWACNVLSLCTPVMAGAAIQNTVDHIYAAHNIEAEVNVTAG
jgi:hypothetical protein